MICVITAKLILILQILETLLHPVDFSTANLSVCCSPCWSHVPPPLFSGFVQFIQKDIADTNNQLVDSSIRLLMTLVSKYNTQKVGKNPIYV